jgi:hypothetical protein
MLKDGIKIIWMTIEDFGQLIMVVHGGFFGRNATIQYEKKKQNRFNEIQGLHESKLMWKRDNAVPVNLMYTIGLA